MNPFIPAPRAIARTAAYRERMEERRRLLAEHVARILLSCEPFVWEVGCGHGHFLTAYAQAHAGPTCVGIDIAGDRIERALRKRDRARLPHLHFLQADARLFLETMPRDVSFARVFILFPDPWPKLRHHKHRIFQADFLSAMASHATSVTRVYFRTDHQPYFDAARSTLERHGQWEVVEEPWPFEHLTVFQARADRHHSLVARLRKQN